MKRSVREPTVLAELKALAKPTVLGALALLAISALTQPSMTVFYLIAFAIIGIIVILEEPPRWLLRSPIGGWVRRYSERRR